MQAVVYNGFEREAVFVADTIEAMRQRRPSMKLSDIAVLYRTHFHREKVLAELRQRDISVHVQGVDLFDTPEVRDAMAALQVMESSDPIALVRVAAFPQFSVDPEEFRAALAVAGKKASTESLLEKVPGGFAVMEAVREARHDLANASDQLAAAMKIAQPVFQLADSLPLRRLQELAEQWSKKPKPLVGQGTLREFLEYVEWFREASGCLSRGWRRGRSDSGAGAYRLQQAACRRRGAIDDGARRQRIGVSVHFRFAGGDLIVSTQL